MSDALRASLETNIDDLTEILHTVRSSGLDFGFSEEQLSYQIEGLISSLYDQVEVSLKLAEVQD